MTTMAPAIAADAERMSVPKPGPDQILLAICGADDAICWTIGDKATMGEPGVMGAMVTCLEDGQRVLREDRDHGARADDPVTPSQQ